MCSRMGSGEGDGDAQGGVHREEEAKGGTEEEAERHRSSVGHRSLMGARRCASVRKRTEGERGPGERRR